MLSSMTLRGKSLSEPIHFISRNLRSCAARMQHGTIARAPVLVSGMTPRSPPDTFNCKTNCYHAYAIITKNMGTEIFLKFCLPSASHLRQSVPHHVWLTHGLTNSFIARTLFVNTGLRRERLHRSICETSCYSPPKASPRLVADNWGAPTRSTAHENETTERNGSSARHVANPPYSDAECARAALPAESFPPAVFFAMHETRMTANSSLR